MNRRTYLEGLGAGVVAGAVSTGAAAGQQSNGTDGGSDAGGGAGGGQTHTVEMITDGSSVYFDPIGLLIQPGDTVEFVNASGSHSATSYSQGNPKAEANRIPEGAAGFDSGTLEEQGATFSHTFETPGTYDYFCLPHKSLGMVGRIVCGEPGGPATEGSIPDAPRSGVMPTSEQIVEGESLAYPFVPGGGGLDPLPWQFWLGTGLFATVVTYLFSKYDRESGRYAEEYADGDV